MMITVLPGTFLNVIENSFHALIFTLYFNCNIKTFLTIRDIKFCSLSKIIE